MKICKQCNRLLDDSCFRDTKTRSMGIRRSTPGSRSICRQCESMTVRAHRVNMMLDAGEPVDEALIRPIKDYYQRIVDAGYQLLHAATQRLMGVEPPKVVEDADQTDGLDDLYKHISAIRHRTYNSFEEADAAHTKLMSRLKAAGLYEEANNLIDEWFEEGE